MDLVRSSPRRRAAHCLEVALVGGGLYGGIALYLRTPRLVAAAIFFGAAVVAFAGAAIISGLYAAREIAFDGDVLRVTRPSGTSPVLRWVDVERAVHVQYVLRRWELHTRSGRLVVNDAGIDAPDWARLSEVIVRKLEHLDPSCLRSWSVRNENSR